MTDIRLSPSGPNFVITAPDVVSRVYDITQAPYKAVANDPAQAAHNTQAIQAAIDDATAQGGGGVVWFPPLFGGYYVTGSAHGPNPQGYTSALRLHGPVTLMGAGSAGSAIRFVATVPADAVIDNDASAYTGIIIKGLQIDGMGAALFGIKGWLLPYLEMTDVYSSGALSVGIALDQCFECVLRECNVYNSPHIGMALGAWSDAGQAVQVIGLKANSFGRTGVSPGVGLFIHGGDAIKVQNFSAGVGDGVALMLVGTNTVSIDTCRFERNNENVGDGVVFTNFAGPTRTDVWFHRGTFSMAAPTAWTFTLDPVYPPTSAAEQAVYNNPGCSVTNCSFTSTLTPHAAVSGNAATGLVLQSNDFQGSPAAPLFGFISQAGLGYVMQWTETGNSDFAPSVSLSSTANHLWGSVNLSDVCETLIAGTDLGNLIGDDTLASLATRFPNDTNTGNGSLYYDVTASYEGRPVFIFGGGDHPAGCGVQLDLDGKDILLRGALMYIAATVEVALAPLNVVAASMLVTGDPNQAAVFGAGNFVSGWQKRAQIVKLPNSGTITLGFTKYGVSAARIRDMVIARVGAPYSQVVTASRGKRTRKRSMLIQPYYANVGEAYNVGGAGTICGVPMTIVNPGAPGTLATVAGAGFNVVPFAASDFLPGNITAPRLEFDPNLLIPDYNVNMRLTWRVVNSVATMPSNDDQVFVALYDGSNMSGAGTTGSKILRGKVSGSPGIQDFLYQSGASVIGSGVVIALDLTNSGLVLDMPVPGQWQPAWYSEPATAAGTPNPKLRQCLPSNWSAALGTANNLTTANARLVVGAKRAGGVNAGVLFTIPTLILEWEP